MPDTSSGDQPTISCQVAAAVARLRQEQRLPYTELAERLAELGRPIPVLGLRRIERGERRVDVDEVAALARALRVPPAALLFPLGMADTVEILPGFRVDTWAAAKWFDGSAPFPPPVGKIRDMTVDDDEAPARRPFELYRAYERHLAEWSRAKLDSSLAMLGADPAGGEQQIRREESDRAERAALAAEQELVKIRRTMIRHGITPPAVTDLRLTHIEGAEEE